jgi:protein-L-isoaspartate(D-aspartate) O-methyltransferase
MMSTDSARRQMVEQQVRTWDVFDDEVLGVIGSVPRDRYVPGKYRDCAYADGEILLDHGQCMLRPSICGRILQAIDVTRNDRILEIGTGTGYLTHCLALLGAHVTSIDLYQDFVDSAKKNTEAAGINNVEFDCMDASKSLPAGQFDVVVITCAVEDEIDRFVAALKPGGRLFVVTGKSPARKAVLVTRREDGGSEQVELFETDIPAMVTAPKPPVFSF